MMKSLLSLLLVAPSLMAATHYLDDDQHPIADDAPDPYYYYEDPVKQGDHWQVKLYRTELNSLAYIYTLTGPEFREENINGPYSYWAGEKLRIFEQGTMLHHQIHGLWQSFPYNQVTIIAQYDHGKKNGLFLKYQPVADAPPSLPACKDNSLTSTETGCRFNNPDRGPLWVTGHFENDLQQGEFKVFYPTGELNQRGSFEQGKLEGISLTYYANGTVGEKATYHHGVKNGEFIKYDDQGQLQQKSHYTNDQLDGQSHHYFADGTLQQSGQWAHGKAVGEHQTFYRSNQLQKVENYSRKQPGFLLSSKTYNSKGQMVEHQLRVKTPYGPGSKTINWHGFQVTYRITSDNKRYYHKETHQLRDGTLLSESTTVDRKRHGRFYSDTTDGDTRTLSDYHYKHGQLDGAHHYKQVIRGELYVEETGQYLDDKADGLWVKQKYQRKIYQHYRRGLEHGEHKETFLDGKLNVLRYYRDGKPEGKYLVKNEAGEIMVQGQYVDGKEEGFWQARGEVCNNYTMAERCSGHMHKGEAQGLWRGYNEQGYLTELISYQQGKKNGRLVRFDDDGALSWIAHYQNGRLEGRTLDYSYGVLDRIQFYQDGSELYDQRIKAGDF